MATSNDEDLVKRIAKLVRQNQELDDEIKTLKKEYETLSNNYEKLKESLSSSTPGTASKVQTYKFNMATVLFANIHGFAKMNDSINSSEMMDELDEILIHFDDIAKKYNIEKIKTIGDTYMCAGGIPVKNITNPIDVVMAAMEMRNFLEEYETKNHGQGNNIWELQIGIHTGPVTANMSGKKKISYDIKGDTVNMASRIEANTAKESIAISVMTYELVKEFFDCEYYGKIPVKYKDDLQIFMVTGLKKELSVDGAGQVPNDAYRIKFGLIQFTDIQELILDKLEKELPSYLFYHNVKHTVDVVTEVELIGCCEGCSDEELLYLKLAGLFHDVGHTVTYQGHEKASAEIARQMLPKYNYSPEQIEQICSIILATELPPRPQNLLQEIICDSDLDYLGRSDFVPVSNTLYDELKAQNKVGSLNSWNKTQVKFISGHQYFTNTAKRLREVNKQSQIERLQGIITDEE